MLVVQPGVDKMTHMLEKTISLKLVKKTVAKEGLDCLFPEN